MNDRPPITRDNPDWIKLKLWLHARVRKLQRELQSTIPTLEQQHNITRGRIAELLDLLNGVEPKPLLEEDQLQATNHYFDE